MTAMIDAEEHYYTLLREHEEQFGEVDEATDEALAATAEAVAAAHNAKVCQTCGQLQSQPVRGECHGCRRRAAAAEAEADLPALDAQIARLEARRNQMLAALDR